MFRIFSALALAGLLAGCDVYPMTPPPGAVVVQPVGVAPGPGYDWRFRGGYGWGWHHPFYGWRGHFYR